MTDKKIEKGTPRDAHRLKGDPLSFDEVNILRKRIIDANPVNFLIQVMQGEVKKTDTMRPMINIPVKERTDAAKILIQKIAPDIKTVSVDMTADVESKSDNTVRVIVEKRTSKSD